MNDLNYRIELLDAIAKQHQLMNSLENTINSINGVTPFCSDLMEQWHSVRSATVDLEQEYSMVFMNPLEGKVEEVDDLCDALHINELLISEEKLHAQMLTYELNLLCDTPQYREMERDLAGTQQALKELLGLNI